MDNAVITLKKGEGRTLKAGGMWVYDNEIASIRGSYENGDIVRVEDFDGYPMGKGFINDNSVIRIRMMTRDADAVIDEHFLRERLQRAWDYRKAVIDTGSCRIVFGEADYLPGLVIDKYEDVLVIQVSALGMDRMKEQVVPLITDILEQDGMHIRGIYERSDGKYRDLEGMERINDFIGDRFDTKVPIAENNVKYYVDVKEGQKTGFFLDQKINRLAVQKISRGREVLDCFTHTGSFALNAAYGGAAQVTGVDASETAIEQARENARLNGFGDSVRFARADVLDLLPMLAQQGKEYDLVILDPPAFTKSRKSVKKAIKGYREINMKGMKIVKNGGFLATCSCSHFMTNDLFMQMLSQAASSVHKRLKQVEFNTQAPDHPILWGMDETNYLKFYIFQVLDEF